MLPLRRRSTREAGIGPLPHGRQLKGSLLAVTLVWLSCGLLQQTAASEQASRANDPGGHGHAEAGQKVFNGKGICHYCHGIDGYLDKPPPLAPDTAVLIAQLNPAPADLRNPGTLRLKSDKARTKAIREGHTGTAMFPTTTLNDQEIVDILAYLSVLRRQSVSQGKP
jgi:mono/diheme cytochrome c family protein